MKPPSNTVSILLILLVKIPKSEPAAPGQPPEEPPKLEKIFDESCQLKEGLRSFYEFGYGDEINSTSLFKIRPDKEPDSYLGYPCNMKLYETFRDEFRKRGLNCPFVGDLELRFRKFIQNELWTKNQTKTAGAKDDDAKKYPNTLLFQYICFAHQFEECVPDPKLKALGGSCDGICRCMDAAPITRYPSGFNAMNNKPKIINESDVRCGVLAGGLCIPQWDTTCKKGAPGYDEKLEKNYKMSDFYFKCESNAGCHDTKRVCQCAEGHSCKGSSGNRLHFVYSVLWVSILATGICNTISGLLVTYFNRLVSKEFV